MKNYSSSQKKIFMKLKKILPLMIAIVLIVLSFSCSKSKNDVMQPPPVNGNDSSVTINIYNMAFPASTTVKKGTIVKWYNQDGFAHTVTSNDGTSFNSGNLAAGGTFSYTANKVGTFDYHCTIHSGMNGTLVVTE